mmetsp:Transcript_106529/g.227510  ORF Transcript_106529/g.227510 Transcript_106529/m.227510 type:complete len:269 (+) Transcript_106529:680-1486(+)
MHMRHLDAVVRKLIGALHRCDLVGIDTVLTTPGAEVTKDADEGARAQFRSSLDLLVIVPVHLDAPGTIVHREALVHRLLLHLLHASYEADHTQLPVVDGVGGVRALLLSPGAGEPDRILEHANGHRGESLCLPLLLLGATPAAALTHTVALRRCALDEAAEALGLGWGGAEATSAAREAARTTEALRCVSAEGAATIALLRLLRLRWLLWLLEGAEVATLAATGSSIASARSIVRAEHSPTATPNGRCGDCRGRAAVPPRLDARFTHV